MECKIVGSMQKTQKCKVGHRTAISMRQGDYRIIFNGDKYKITEVKIIVNKEFDDKIKNIIY